MAYLRSIFLMSNKKLFQIESIDVVKLSASLGLVVAPRIRFLQRSQNQNKPSDDDSNENSQEDENKEEEEKKPKNKNKKLEMLRKKALERAKPLNFAEFHQEDNNDGLFTVRKVFTPNASKVEESDDDEFDDPNKMKKIKVKTKASLVKQIKKKKIKVNEKIEFDDEGNRIITSINQPRSINITDELAEELNKKDDGKGYSGIDIEEAKRMLKNEDQFDKQIYRERVKRMHREKRYKEKEIRRAKRGKGNDGEPIAEPVATLKTDGDFSDQESDEE